MNQAENSVATHDNEYRFYRIVSEKSVNKQKQQQQIATIANTGDGGESDFQSCHIMLF